MFEILLLSWLKRTTRMIKDSKKLPSHHEYFNHEPQVEYLAKYRNGVFINAHSNMPVELKEGAYARIVVSNYSILLKDYEEHKRREVVDMFLPGEEFYFDLETRFDGIVRFYLRNREKITLVKIGNKMPRFTHTSCEVYNAENSSKKYLESFKPIRAKSFNEAFIRVSEQYCQGKGAHVCNVYKVFYHKTRGMIDYLREVI